MNEEIPKEFYLHQNYPNPFNPTTWINYDLPKSGRVNLIIYDILGREIIKLVNDEFIPAGKHTAIFAGQNLKSSIYFYCLEVNDGKDFRMFRKMIFVK